MDTEPDQPSSAERLAELRDRFEATLRRLDLRARIEEHPWELIGTAALLGAWLGFAPPKVRPVREGMSLRARLGEMLLSSLGALALRLVREAAYRQFCQVAKRWWEEASNAAPPDSDVQYDSVPEAMREPAR